MTGNRKYVEKTAVAVLQPLHLYYILHSTQYVHMYANPTFYGIVRSSAYPSCMTFSRQIKLLNLTFTICTTKLGGLFIKRFSNNRNWVNLIVSMVHICNSCKCNYFNCHGQNMYLGIYWTVEAIANFCEVKIVPLLSKCS